MDFNLINIKPCDNTFFGDGNQFSFDVSKVIRSKNTPYPSVFFGAIFTAILTHNDDFRQAFFQKGKYDHEQILEIGQVYLFNEKNKSVYIKAPMDLFINDSNRKVLGNFKEVDNRFQSLSYKYILEVPNDKNYKRVTDKYIAIDYDFQSYIYGLEDEIELLDEESIFVKNYKVGIGLDKNTRKIEEGRLYKIEQTEFINNDWSYIVEYKINKEYLKDKYEGVELKNLDIGYLKLGGENKACKFKSVDKRAISDIQDFNFKRSQNLTRGIYKIVFTSEAYFPNGIDEFLGKQGIEVLGLSNDKPIYIGGYDMKGNGSIRTMYKGYSAGTVILAKIYNDNGKDIYKLLKGSNVKGFNNCVILKEGV